MLLLLLLLLCERERERGCFKYITLILCNLPPAKPRQAKPSQTELTVNCCVVGLSIRRFYQCEIRQQQTRLALTICALLSCHGLLLFDQARLLSRYVASSGGINKHFTFTHKPPMFPLNGEETGECSKCDFLPPSCLSHNNNNNDNNGNLLPFLSF